ncbi:MAG: class I SAM-dependent methyltransferase [Chitinophagales bacterium]|nr:class I SAM-dependent methyltransferase [Chitinophagales bacterium]MDW8418056.1 class I SAM-dependent methyltransferase [Chitinophagales bacterium]
MKFIRNLLQEPRLKGVNPDSTEFLDLHRTILEQKPMMREVFREFYDTCMRYDRNYFTAGGKRVEIGAGVSFFKKTYPEVISTDIKPAPNLDMVVDALCMPFEDNSLRAVYGINCFHHFPDPDRFFSELTRTLAPGGGCVLIDPYYGPAASVFYKHVFDTEIFDKYQPGWTNPDAGVMMNANQALSYVVFVRDAEVLRAKHPQLEVVVQRPLTNYIRYLLCGGLNFRQLTPNWLTPAIKLLEWFMQPLAPIFGLHHVIVIRKRA